MANDEALSGAVVKGEFYTNGKTFVFRLADTSLSGVGPNPGEAFDDLMRSESAAGLLVDQLRDLARDQRSEAVRAALVRSIAMGLIALAIVGGILAGGVALAPKVIADVAASSVERLSTLSPETRRQIAELFGGRAVSVPCPDPAIQR